MVDRSGVLGTRSGFLQLFSLIAAAWMPLTATASVGGLNTIELFDQKRGYFDIGLSFDGLRIARRDSTLAASAISAGAVYGKSLNEYLGGYIGMQAAGNGYFADGLGALFMGIIGTPLDLPNFDFDFLVEAGAADVALEGFYLQPGIELNYDAVADQGSWGLYLDVSELLSGIDTSSHIDNPFTPGIDESPARYVCTPVLTVMTACYVTTMKGQQVHVQFDQSLRHNPIPGERGYVIGVIAAGYNIMLSDYLQLTAALWYDIPQGSEHGTVGIGVGLTRW
jgi:hypothetical protein